MAKGRPKTSTKKEEVKIKFPIIPIEVNPKIQVDAKQVKGVDDLIPPRPSIVKVLENQKITVEFKMLNDLAMYFEIDDEKATISNEDKSKVKTLIVELLKSIDGKYIFNKLSAEKYIKTIEEKKLEISKLEKQFENKVKKIQEVSDEKLERIPKIIRSVFGV